MSAQYQCCKCEECFPVETAVDGFAQGYRSGFLCPLCGAHLASDLIVSERVISGHRGVHAALTVAMLLSLALFYLLSPGWIASIVIVVAMLALLFFAYRKYPSLKEIVWTTQPGSEEKLARDGD